MRGLLSVYAQDLSRFSSFGVAADLQVGEGTVSDDYRTLLHDLVGERAEQVLPVRALLDADAHVVLSSDWGADELSPLGIIEQSLTRSRQAVSDVETAVRLLTIEAAGRPWSRRCRRFPCSGHGG